MNLFEQLGVSKEIVKSLIELGFETPSEIQQNAIPILLETNPDFIGLAQTGTGKTAAFGIPLLDIIDHDSRHTQGLVLAPTRELVQQIAAGLESFSKYLKINVQCVYGGTSISQQIRDIKRKTPHIIIATPGRLIDLLGRGIVNLKSINNFVLDEADEMLNMGFKEEIDKILSHASQGEDRSTWLFSATMPNEIKRIVKEYMVDPKEVKINPKSIVNKNISHQYASVRGRDKTEALKRIIDFHKDLYGITFCRTKMDTQRVANDLLEAGYKADAINGDLSQNQRDQVMDRFKSGKLQMLIATDVAARGIDVNNLTHVVHYDMPDDLEYYTHRSGRTARAGNKGESIAFVAHSDMYKVRRIEKNLKVSFEKTLIPTQDQLKVAVLNTWAEKVLDISDEDYDIPSDLQNEVIDQLADISKEELIRRLAGFELAKKAKAFGTNDINLSDRKERSGDDQNSTKGTRFYINLGSMDGVQKSELLRIICDEVGLKKRNIGTIEVRKNGSTFIVDPSKKEDVVSKLSGFEYEGRSINVKLDDKPSGGSSRAGGRNRGFRSGDGGRRRSEGGGNSRGGYRKDKPKSSRRYKS